MDELEVRIQVVSVEVSCDACQAHGLLDCLGRFSGWALMHYQPRMIVVNALVNGEPRQLQPVLR